MPVTVPNVVGLTQAAATTAITGAGLVVGTVTTANSATVPAGSVISQNPAAGASVAAGSAVALVVSLGPAAAGPAVDKTAFSEGAGTRTTTAFVTAAANEQIVAFAASDGPPSVNAQTLTISGGGLVWTRVQRAADPLRCVRNLDRAGGHRRHQHLGDQHAGFGGFHQSLTVVAFTGVSAIGASAAGGAISGASSLSLVSQAAGSLVYGVGNDWDSATARTLPAGQTMVHQFVDTAVGDTFWVQSVNAATTAVGQTVTVNTTAPTADQWNVAIVEIKR